MGGPWNAPSDTDGDNEADRPTDGLWWDEHQ